MSNIEDISPERRKMGLSRILEVTIPRETKVSPFFLLLLHTRAYMYVHVHTQTRHVLIPWLVRFVCVDHLFKDEKNLRLGDGRNDGC